LQRYIVERLELQLNNPDTCWKRFASNNWCSFWSDPVVEFNEPEKRKVIEKFNNYHQTRSGKKHLISYEVEGSLLRRDEDGFVFITSDSTTNESKVLDMNSDDKVLKLVSSIQEVGFSNRLSSLNPIILGYSTKDNYFQVLSGRHRIASLLYLAKIGMVSEDLEIVCHQVHYDFDSLSLPRPFIKHCKECVANNFVFTDS